MKQTTMRPRQTLDVRTARDTDARAVIRLLETNHHLEIAFEPSQFLVGEKQGNIVACARLKPLGQGTFEIASVVVDPAFQRHGFGAQIVKARLAEVRGVVYALAIAPEFFRVQGFQEIPHVPAALEGKATSVCRSSGFVPMQRVLS